MSKSIQDLRERRAAKAQEARTLLDTNTGDKWTASVANQVDTLYNEIGTIDEQIRRHDRQAEIEAAEKLEPFHQKDHDPKSAKALYNKWLRGGDNALSAEDWTHIRNTMSTTTPSEGGYTVESDVASQLIDAMKQYGAVRAVAEIIPTAQGNPLSYPTSDGTAETGELIAENTTATAADPSFNTVALNAYKFSSKVVAVPIELLQDATIDIEAFVRRRLAQRLGRIQNTFFTTGTGSSQPRGIVAGAALGKTGTTGQTATIIYDDLVDLIHSVDPAYRNSRCRFMTNDALLKVIRKLKDSQNRPIWLPSFEAGITLGPGARPGSQEPGGDTVTVPFDVLMGYPLYVNNDMATPAANAKTLLFGDMSYYKVRDVMNVSLFRFTDSAYTKLGQVGFLGWARAGGNLVDTAAVKHYAHSAT